MSDSKEKIDKRVSKKQSVNKYMKYSGLAFQMFFTIGLATWFGMWLDEYWALKYPVFTAGLALLAVIGVMFSVIRSLTKDT